MGNIDIRTLDCGIRVVMEELDHVKSAAVGIWVRNGGGRDARGRRHIPLHRTHDV